MPVVVYFLKSFDRSLEGLPQVKQEAVRDIVKEIIRFVNRELNVSYGLRVKKLTTTLFEARIDIHLRLLFELKKAHLVFILVGNHDQVKKYLSSL